MGEDGWDGDGMLVCWAKRLRFCVSLRLWSSTSQEHLEERGARGAREHNDFACLLPNLTVRSRHVTYVCTAAAHISPKWAGAHARRCGMSPAVFSPLPFRERKETCVRGTLEAARFWGLDGEGDGRGGRGAAFWFLKRRGGVWEVCPADAG